MDFYGQVVAAITKERGDFKLSGQFAVFAVAHVGSVAPEIKSRFYGTKMNEYLFILPLFRQKKAAAVQSHRIVRFRNRQVSRTHRIFVGILTVLSEKVMPTKIGTSIVFEFPVCRDLKIIPLKIFVKNFLETGRNSGWAGHPTKLPEAVQTFKIPGFFHALVRIFDRSKRKKRRPHRFPIHRTHLRILPFRNLSQ